MYEGVCLYLSVNPQANRKIESQEAEFIERVNRNREKAEEASRRRSIARCIARRQTPKEVELGCGGERASLVFLHPRWTLEGCCEFD